MKMGSIIVYIYGYILWLDVYNEIFIVKASDLYYITSAGREDHEQCIIFSYVKNEVFKWEMI